VKYEFVEVDEDITELRYKDKKFQAKRNINLVKDYEDVERKAKIQFIADLKKEGLSINDLVSETKDNGKTKVDYSNVDYLQREYVEKKKIEFFQNFCKSITGMSLEELITDIGLEDSECTQFGIDFSQMISGIRKKEEFPSKKQNS
jgi:hypothetical protein